MHANHKGRVMASGPLLGTLVSQMLDRSHAEERRPRRSSPALARAGLAVAVLIGALAIALGV